MLLRWTVQNRSTSPVLLKTLSIHSGMNISYCKYKMWVIFILSNKYTIFRNRFKKRYIKIYKRCIKKRKKEVVPMDLFPMLSACGEKCLISFNLLMLTVAKKAA